VRTTLAGLDSQRGADPVQEAPEAQVEALIWVEVITVEDDAGQLAKDREAPAGDRELNLLQGR
jgi:hypothetical protein